jgi:hypothetical protein
VSTCPKIFLLAHLPIHKKEYIFSFHSECQTDTEKAKRENGNQQ